jgi:hypothetical protein
LRKAARLVRPGGALAFHEVRMGSDTRACSHYCKVLLLISRQDGDYRSAV